MKLEVGWAVKFVSRTSCFWDAQSYCRRAPAHFHAHARSRGSGPRSIRELTCALLFIVLFGPFIRHRNSYLLNFSNSHYAGKRLVDNINDCVFHYRGWPS
jgi:hypothetical protein